MTRRRDFLLGSAAALGAMTAGCSEDLLGDGPLRFESGRTHVPASVADQAGYELVDSSEQVVERTIEVGDESRSVEAVNWLARYEKRVDGERIAIFGALTTPQAEVLGQSYNPVADQSKTEIAARIRDEFDQIHHLESGPESTIAILEEETTVTRFDGEVELDDGSAVDGYVHVNDPVATDEDFVIAVGGYPQRFTDESDRVRTMMKRLEYEA